MADRQPRCSTIGYGEDFSAMTIYNYGYYISQPLATPSTALSAMFAVMSPGPYTDGGLAFVPQQEFGVAASSSGFAVPDQCNVVGSGGGGSSKNTPFYHFIVTYEAGSLFFNCGGDYTSGGKYFRSLGFKGTVVGGAGDTCIYAGTENCRAVNCTFTDISLAFNAQGDRCSLEQCTVDYAEIAGATAIIIAGANCGVMGPVCHRHSA